MQDGQDAAAGTPRKVWKTLMSIESQLQQGEKVQRTLISIPSEAGWPGCAGWPGLWGADVGFLAVGAV